jgi:hypothetical protein
VEEVTGCVGLGNGEKALFGSLASESPSGFVVSVIQRHTPRQQSRPRWPGRDARVAVTPDVLRKRHRMPDKDGCQAR